MFSVIAEFVGKRPYTVILVILTITGLFSSLLPSMKSGTSMEDFLPKDNKLVQAENKVTEYFGGGSDVEMVLVESKRDIMLPSNLRKLHRIVMSLNDTEGVENVFGISNLVEAVSFAEYHKPLSECSDEEIEMLIQDIFFNESFIELCTDSKYQKKGYADIEKAWMIDRDGKFQILIKLRDLSEIGDKCIRPVEWDVCFLNGLAPCEELKINYMIGARYEPGVKWVVGNGLLNNIKNILRRSEWENNVYLWMKPKNFSTYFPIKLEESSFFFDFDNSAIVINLSKDELGKFGIAPKFNGNRLPARLVNLSIKSRIYRFPWFGVGIKGEELQRFLNWIEKLKIITRAMERRGINIEEMKTILSHLDANLTLSMKDLNGNWVVLDSVNSTRYILIKPPFFNDIAESIESMLSEDGKTTLVIVQENKTLGLNEAKKVGKELCIKIKELEDDFHMEITGGSVISYQIDVLTSETNKYIAPGIFIVIMLILLIHFRRISYIFLPLVCLSISIVWLFGSMVLLGIKFNAISVALVPLIMGLGVDYSVHLFYNYRAELSKGMKPLDAIKTSIKNVGTAMFLATLTTSISFLSFLSSSIPPIRDFGILCAFGIFYAFIVTVTFEAAVVYLLDKKKKRIVSPDGKRLSLGRGMRAFSSFVLKNGKYIAIFLTSITIIFSYSATKVSYSFSMEEFLPKNTPAMKTLGKISDLFPSASRMEEYILIEGDICSVKTMESIYKIIENMKDDKTIARYPDGRLKVESILSVIEDAAKINGSIIEKFNLDSRFIPRTDRDLKNLLDYLYEREPSIKYVLHRNRGYDATLIRVHLVNEEISSEFTKSVYTELTNDVISCGNVKVTVTGPISLIYTITKSLTESQLKSTFVCLFVAGVVLIAVYRKISLGGIAMTPVILSCIWIIGSIYLLNYTLNVMTVMVTSLTIGLGITYAIHAIERYKLVLQNSKNGEKVVEDTFAHIGGAIFISALTTIAGFSILVLSPMPPEQQFGIITALTIFYALVTTLLVVPILLLLYTRRLKKSERK